MKRTIDYTRERIRIHRNYKRNVWRQQFINFSSLPTTEHPNLRNINLAINAGLENNASLYSGMGGSSCTCCTWLALKDVTQLAFKQLLRNVLLMPLQSGQSALVVPPRHNAIIEHFSSHGKWIFPYSPCQNSSSLIRVFLCDFCERNLISR